MNKKLVIIGAIVVIVLLAGVGYMLLAKSMKPTESANTQKSNSNVISSIADALAKSMSLKCDYSTTSGTKVLAYIKNGMVRSDIAGSTEAESSHSIIKDKKIYFWGAQGGYVMTIPEVSVTPADGQDAATGAQSTLSALEQYKNYCKASSVSDSLFVLPTGVKFQDMSTMMPSGAMTPSGAQVAPSGMSQEQIQEMMKKYQQPQQ